MSDVSVIVADATRLAAIRDALRPSGHVMLFTAGMLAPAMESIRTYQPKLIAIDALFVKTPSGAAFVDRIDALPGAGSAIRLIVQHEGRWATMPRNGSPNAKPSQPAVDATPQPSLVAPSREAVASVANPA